MVGVAEVGPTVSVQGFLTAWARAGKAGISRPRSCVLCREAGDGQGLGTTWVWFQVVTNSLVWL